MKLLLSFSYYIIYFMSMGTLILNIYSGETNYGSKVVSEAQRLFSKKKFSFQKKMWF